MENSENLAFKEKVKKLRTSDESSISSFLQKTYEILEDPSWQEIVSWGEDGRSLVIKDPKEFSEKVLPSHFKHGNISSFIRQLNMYDFKKIKSKTYEFVFAHDMFQRGRRDLLREIRRKSSDVSLVLNKNRINIDDVSERDPATLQQENMVLKRVQKEMLDKIKHLENRVYELTKQNEILTTNLQPANQQNHHHQMITPKDGLPFQQLQPGQHVQYPFGSTTQQVPQFVQVQLPGQIIQPQWNMMSNIPTVNNHQQNGHLQGINPNFMAAPSQMNFVMLPSMQPLDQGKPQVAILHNGLSHMPQNGIMMMPQIGINGSENQANFAVKTEESRLPNGEMLNEQNLKSLAIETNSQALRGSDNKSANMKSSDVNNGKSSSNNGDK